eukprot:69001_1
MDEKDITLPTQSQDAGPVDSEQIRMRFHCNELMQLLDIEAVCNEYLGKDVGVVVQNKADIYYGKLNIISADGYVYLEHVNWDFDDEYQPGAMFHILKIQKVSLVDTDCLIENSSKYKESKDITQHILDAIKLKTSHDVLHFLVSSGLKSILDCIGPLNALNRKTFLDKHTSPKHKRMAGQSIINGVQLSLNVDSLNTDLSQWIKFWIHQHTPPGYHLYPESSAAFEIHHIVALLYYYHQLWKKHIMQDDVDIKGVVTEDMDIYSIPYTRQNNYMGWDESNEISGNLMMNATVDTPKARNVYIGSIWPYDFFGPCTKLKKNHADWMCLNCKKNGRENESLKLKELDELYKSYDELLLLSMPTQMNSDQLVFYKAKRTDLSVEICQQCVVDECFKQNKTISTKRMCHMSFPEPCLRSYCVACMDEKTTPVSCWSNTPPMLFPEWMNTPQYKEAMTQRSLRKKREFPCDCLQCTNARKSN